MPVPKVPYPGRNSRPQYAYREANVTQFPQPDSPPPASPHTHTSEPGPGVRAAQLTTIGAADTCSGWADPTAAGKPECSAPQFPGSDAHALLTCCTKVSRFMVKSSSHSFQPQPLTSQSWPSHFLCNLGVERPQKWGKPLPPVSSTGPGPLGCQVPGVPDPEACRT